MYSAKSQIYVATVLTIIFLLCYFLIKSFTTPQVDFAGLANKTPMPVQNGGMLISNQIGEVANVFSWGFNRHLCFDDTTNKWWVFYFRTAPNNKPGVIVYRSSSDNGKSWSQEVRLDATDIQAADFTIDCAPPYVSVAYSDTGQMQIFWKKGKMADANINWLVASTAMPSKISYTHVIPSIVYYQGKPVVSAHDQSNEGAPDGRKKSAVAMANDPDGKTWTAEKVIFDEPVNHEPGSLAFTSLGIARDKLVALVNGKQYQMYYVLYQGNNTWSEPILLDDFDYGGGTPEWSTITDSKGILHVVYPKSCCPRKARHAMFDGENWRYETIENSIDSSQQQTNISIDDDDNLYIVSGSLVLAVNTKGQWQQVITLPSKPNGSQIQLTNLTQRVFKGKLGIAWQDGSYVNPNAWFACLEKHQDGDAIRLEHCL